MTQKHTPGPWLVQGDDIVTDGFTVGGVNIEDAEKRPEEAKANLALMANAPELLEALEALWGYSRWCSETNNVPNFIQDDIGGCIQNAIKKAKGEL